MNGRTSAPPTNWTFILATTGGALLLGFLFLKFFFIPWQQNNKSLARAEEEYDQEDRSYKTFLREKKKLESYRLVGLPRNLEAGSTGYTEYLQTLMTGPKGCGFSRDDVVIKPTGNEEKPKSPSAGTGKKPLHIVMGFQVDAKGTWLNVTKFLKEFQRTPFLHRIRNLAVSPTSRNFGKGKLTITMNIEAMVVNKNELRPDNLWCVDPRLLAVDSALALFGRPGGGWALLRGGQALLAPEMPKRRYDDLAWVNPFRGGKPVSPYAPEKPKDPKKKRSEFRLVLTNPSDQRALLLASSKDKNIVVELTGPPEPSMVLAGGAVVAAPHLQAFTVFDGIDTVQGTVLRVDLRQVYVQIGRKVYEIGFEKPLTDYLRRPLSGAELGRLGLVRRE
jgi:hypothetical protein